MFERAITQPNAQSAFVTAGSWALSLLGLNHLQAIWSWVVSGYVTIPCDVSGSANALTLTPRLSPKQGASGYTHLLSFSFVAAETSTDTVTLAVSNGSVELDRLPVYVGATLSTTGSIVAGVPYFAFYCEAQGALPERFVRMQ